MPLLGAVRVSTSDAVPEPLTLGRPADGGLVAALLFGVQPVIAAPPKPVIWAKAGPVTASIATAAPIAATRGEILVRSVIGGASSDEELRLRQVTTSIRQALRATTGFPKKIGRR